MILKFLIMNKKRITLFLFVLVSFIIFENIVFENIIGASIGLYKNSNIYKAFIYIFVTMLGFFSNALILFVRNKVVYISLLIITIITNALDLVYKKINGAGCTTTDLNIIKQEGKGLFFESIITYYESIIQSLIIVTLLVMFYYIIRKVIIKNTYYINFRWVVGFYIVSIMFSYSIFFKTLGSTNLRPTNIKIVNSLIYNFTNSLYYGKRIELKEFPSSNSRFKDIILIIDESIEGEYLSINGFNLETTPYLKSIQNLYVNLGIASASSNCSASSNLILMSGVQVEELPDLQQYALRGPSIFQYAKNAGFKTHYLNGQGFTGGFTGGFCNFMTKFDLKYIDDYSLLDKYGCKSMPEEDLILKTKEILTNSDKNFIFMVKRGSHFPWQHNYPKTHKYFAPDLKDNEPLSIEGKDKAINSYLNSVRYNVDDFFKCFLNQIDFIHKHNTLIIYSSDHGQSILENCNKATHCQADNPPLSQGKVPLLLFSNDEESLVNNFNFKSDIYSHFQIFPTLQKIMGYKLPRGKTLFEINEENFTQKFVSKNLFWTPVILNDLNRIQN